MLNKKYRLKGNYDLIYNKGYRAKGKFGMLIGLESRGLQNSEFGFVVGKKIGKANERNKLKRRLRYIVQDLINKDCLEKVCLQFLYISFENTDSFSALEEEFLKQFNEIVKNFRK